MDLKNQSYGEEDSSRSRQSIVLFKSWSFRGKKRKTFLLQFFQHMLLVAVIFTTTTIFTNYNIVFGNISKLLSEGQAVDLNSKSIPSSLPSLSSFNWNDLSGNPFGQLILSSGSNLVVSEMNHVMLLAGVITIGLLILRESWNSFHQSRLTFLQLEVPIRGVLYHGASRRAVVIFNMMIVSLQAVSAYIVGILASTLVVLPLIEATLRDTFFNFLVSSIPLTSYIIAAIPVSMTFFISLGYFSFRIRSVKLN
jgi:hypothetical protein